MDWRIILDALEAYRGDLQAWVQEGRDLDQEDLVEARQADLDRVDRAIASVSTNCVAPVVFLEALPGLMEEVCRLGTVDKIAVIKAVRMATGADLVTARDLVMALPWKI